MKIILLILVVVIAGLATVALIRASNVTDKHLSEDERLRLYNAILERDNLTLRIQPLQKELDQRTKALGAMQTVLYEKYGVDPKAFTINFYTGEFQARPVPPQPAAAKDSQERK